MLSLQLPYVYPPLALQFKVSFYSLLSPKPYSQAACLYGVVGYINKMTYRSRRNMTTCHVALVKVITGSWAVEASSDVFLVSKFHRYLIWLRIMLWPTLWSLHCVSQTSLKQSVHCCKMQAKRRHCHWGILLPWRGVAGIQHKKCGHKSSLTQAFPVNHWPEHRYSSSSLFSSHSAFLVDLLTCCMAWNKMSFNLYHR